MDPQLVQECLAWRKISLLISLVRLFVRSGLAGFEIADGAELLGGAGLGAEFRMIFGAGLGADLGAGLGSKKKSQSLSKISSSLKLQWANFAFTAFHFSSCAKDKNS